MMGAEHEVDISDDFHLSSQRAGEASSKDFGMGKDLLQDFLSGLDHFSIKILTLIFLDLLNPLMNPLLGFLSESLKINQSILETGVFQFTHGLDIESVMKGFDLFGPQAGDLQHLQMAWRDGVFQFLMKLKSTRGDQFSDVLS